MLYLCAQKYYNRCNKQFGGTYETEKIYCLSDKK